MMPWCLAMGAPPVVAIFGIQGALGIGRDVRALVFDSTPIRPGSALRQLVH